MQRNGILALIFLGSLIIQAAFISVLPIKIKPDLVLVLVILYALLNGVRGGLAAGAIMGLLLDLLRGRVFGMNLLALALTAGAAGWLENKIFKENLLVPVVVVFIASLLHGLLMLCLGYMAGLSNPLKTGVQIAVFEALFNIFLVPLVYRRFLVSTKRGLLRVE